MIRSSPPRSNSYGLERGRYDRDRPQRLEEEPIVVTTCQETEPLL